MRPAQLFLRGCKKEATTLSFLGVSALVNSFESVLALRCPWSISAWKGAILKSGDRPLDNPPVFLKGGQRLSQRCQALGEDGIGSTPLV